VQKSGYPFSGLIVAIRIFCDQRRLAGQLIGKKA